MYSKFLKRVIDVLVSFVAISVLMPVLLVVSIVSLFVLGSPIFFCQKRPGRNEIIFRLIKFRTMTNLKDEEGNLLPDIERLTKWGKFLRSTSLDELPGFINVLKGDMSLVGPRPLAVEYLPYFHEEERRRHTVRPGMTGLAQINGRSMLAWDQRLALDVRYVNEISFRQDCLIAYKTVLKLFSREGVAIRGLDDVGDLHIVRGEFNNHETKS